MEPPNEGQSLSAASRTIADVEPVRVGRHRPAGLAQGRRDLGNPDVFFGTARVPHSPQGRAAAPETSSRASLSRRLLALAAVLLGLADSFAPYDFEACRERSALHPSLTRPRRAA